MIIAVDGIDASGKSCFAKKLYETIEAQHKHTILSSIDHFHNPRIERYKKGVDSPIGFYQDSFNLQMLKEKLLNPFKTGETMVTLKAFDCDLDAPTQTDPVTVFDDSILIFEGVFVQRAELRNYWDLTIFLDITFETALKRNIDRQVDKDRIGSKEEIISRYQTRYQPGQQLYFDEAKPKENSDILIDNNDFNQPILIRG